MPNPAHHSDNPTPQARVFAPGCWSAADRFQIEGDEAHHLTRVRRVDTGAVVEVFDGEGQAARAELVETQRRSVWLSLLEPPQRRPGTWPLSVAAAVCKRERMDWLVEKLTELGVERIQPLITQRSVVRPSSSRHGKLERWRRGALEACKQSGRNLLPQVDAPVPLDDHLPVLRQAVQSAAAQPGTALPFHSLCHQWKQTGPTWLIIGPEGGWTAPELDHLSQAGTQPVSLGENILRVETAAVAMSAMVIGCWRAVPRDYSDGE